MRKRLTGVLLAALTASSALTPAAYADADYALEWNGNFYSYEYEHYKGDLSEFSHPVFSEDTGGFSCEWKDAFETTAEVGWGLPKAYAGKSYKAFSGLKMYYDADFYTDGNGYFGIHGWTKYPLAEFYIVEGWGSWRPPGGYTFRRTVTVNGRDYDLYSTIRTNQPSIEGVRTFPQYWSVRQENPVTERVQNRVTATVDLYEMFRQYDMTGLDMSGELVSCGLFVDSYGGGMLDASGSFTVHFASRSWLGLLDYGDWKTDWFLSDRTYAAVTTAPVQTGPAVTTTTEPKLPADENGIFCYDGFEDGIGAWQKRAHDMDTSALAADTEYHAEGKQSLHVTGRSDSWHGAARSLSPYAIEPGKAYSFQAAVMQNGDSNLMIEMGLEYCDSGGCIHYDRIGSAECRKGEWNVIRTDAFMIPAGSTDLKLFFETNDLSGADLSIISDGDYWIDSVTVAEAGKAVPVDLSGAVPAAAAEPRTGDANCDGAVDVADAVLVMRFAAADREAVITDQGIRNADADRNGKTDDSVVTLILQYIAKKRTL